MGAPRGGQLIVLLCRHALRHTSLVVKEWWASHVHSLAGRRSVHTCFAASPYCRRTKRHETPNVAAHCPHSSSRPCAVVAASSPVALRDSFRAGLQLATRAHCAPVWPRPDGRRRRRRRPLVRVGLPCAAWFLEQSRFKRKPVAAPLSQQSRRLARLAGARTPAGRCGAYMRTYWQAAEVSAAGSRAGEPRLCPFLTCCLREGVRACGP